MADIKAKDIAISQSIAANDLILCSSISGTTANVYVDTLADHIIKNKSFSDLNNKSVNSALDDIIHKNLFKTEIFRETISVDSPNTYKKVENPIVINKPSLLMIRYQWVNEQPVSIGLTTATQLGSAKGFHIHTNVNMFYPTPFASGAAPDNLYATGFVDAGTYYLYVAAVAKSSPGNRVYVYKIAEFY